MKIKKCLALLCVTAVTLTGILFTACGGEKNVTLIGITIGTPPSKIEYREGELFDTAGMTVYADYSDGSKVAVSGYIWQPSGKLAASDTSVTVTYQGMSVTQPIKVQESQAVGVFTGNDNGTEVTVTLNASGVWSAVAGKHTASGTWGNSGSTLIFDRGEGFDVEPGNDGNYSFDYSYKDRTVTVSSGDVEIVEEIVFAGRYSINGNDRGEATATLSEDGSISITSAGSLTGKWYKSGSYIEIVIDGDKTYIPVFSEGKYYFEFTSPYGGGYMQLSQLYYDPADPYVPPEPEPEPEPEKTVGVIFSMANGTVALTNDGKALISLGGGAMTKEGVWTYDEANDQYTVAFVGGAFDGEYKTTKEGSTYSLAVFMSSSGGGQTLTFSYSPAIVFAMANGTLTLTDDGKALISLGGGAMTKEGAWTYDEANDEYSVAFVGGAFDGEYKTTKDGVVYTLAVLMAGSGGGQTLTFAYSPTYFFDGENGRLTLRGNGDNEGDAFISLGGGALTKSGTWSYDKAADAFTVVFVGGMLDGTYVSHIEEGVYSVNFMKTVFSYRKGYSE